VEKKIPDRNKQKLYDDYEDSLFRLIMNEVAEKEGMLFEKENEILKNDPEYMPSQKAVKKFKKQLNACRRRNLFKRLYNTKVINKIAVVVLIMVVVFTTAMVSADAFRIEVLNYLIHMEDKYTSFRLIDSSDRIKLGIEWKDSYAPTYVPKGYEVSDSYLSDTFKKVIFQNKQDKDSYILYTESGASNTLAVDTEEASLIEAVKINQTEGTIVAKGSLINIIWEMDNRIFVVEGPIDKEELIKVAESVKSLK
jgi:hypothetical protein